MRRDQGSKPNGAKLGSVIFKREWVTGPADDRAREELKEFGAALCAQGVKKDLALWFVAQRCVSDSGYSGGRRDATGGGHVLTLD